MKRFTQLVCLALVFSVVLAVPVAATGSSPWASNYFGSSSCYLWNVSSAGFQVCFDVTAIRRMTELGASTIKVQVSDDAVNWTTVKTYRKADYPNMTTTAYTAGHESYVNFDDVESDNYYRAYVEFYAADGNGSAEYGAYTSHVYIP